MNCDSIDWLVDILGTLELLGSAGDCTAYDLSTRGPDKSELRRAAPHLADGLYFDGSHWYSVKGFVKKDSYSSNYQITGTAHFCQTFALMIHLGKTNLQVGDYSGNVAKALQFWIDFFTEFPKHNTWVCSNIKKSVWKDRVPDTQTASLASITPTRLLNFLTAARNEAVKFVNCIQG